MLFILSTYHFVQQFTRSSIRNICLSRSGAVTALFVTEALQILSVCLSVCPSGPKMTWSPSLSTVFVAKLSLKRRYAVQWLLRCGQVNRCVTAHSHASNSSRGSTRRGEVCFSSGSTAAVSSLARVCSFTKVRPPFALLLHSSICAIWGNFTLNEILDLQAKVGDIRLRNCH